MKNFKNYTKESFEDINHIDEFGNEYWYARELQSVLDYVEWRKFENVIKKLVLLVKAAVLVIQNILSAPPSCQNALTMQKLKLMIIS